MKRFRIQAHILVLSALLISGLTGGLMAQNGSEDPSARLQVIHNAADPGAALVDVYVNGDLLLDDFAFRTATPFIDVPAEIELSIAVAPPNSSSVDDAIATFQVTLDDGGTYVVFASGFLNPSVNQNGEPFALGIALADGTVLVATPTNTENVVSGIPTEFVLEQNYPNPFNPTTRINYALPETSDVTLTVYNIQGQRVATLVNGRVEAGRHSVLFEANGLASGLYLYRITTGSFSQTAKMMLVK